MSDDDLDDLSGDELGAALVRRQTEKHELTKKILESQVRELRDLHLDFPGDTGPHPTIDTRRKHLQLLEECNSMWDVIPLSKAINYLNENYPAPHLNDESPATEEEKQAYERAIPFDVGSAGVCFIILLLYKPVQSGRIYGDYNDDPKNSLLLMDQGPKDAVIENGFVCGQCLKISPKQRCSRCKILKYCSQECQSSHWKDHKKQCRAERLKPSKEYERQTRRRYAADENGAAITFI